MDDRSIDRKRERERESVLKRHGYRDARGGALAIVNSPNSALPTLCVKMKKTTGAGGRRRVRVLLRVLLSVQRQYLSIWEKEARLASRWETKDRGCPTRARARDPELSSEKHCASCPKYIDADRCCWTRRLEIDAATGLSQRASAPQTPLSAPTSKADPLCGTFFFLCFVFDFFFKLHRNRSRGSAAGGWRGRQRPTTGAILEFCRLFLSGDLETRVSR